MKSFGVGVTLVSIALVAGCEIGQRVYRANGKLLVTMAGSGVPVSGVVQEAEESFYATQIDIMQSQTMLHRVQQRMKKTTEEIDQQLRNYRVTRLDKADIIVASVDSPSADFARDFCNALMDEYLRFREEQRAQTNESVLLALTREINRLSQDLKASNEKILAFTKEHNVSVDAELPEMQMLREERERIRSLYNALLGQLMKIDVTQNFSARSVNVLESAIVEPKPVRGWSR